MRDNFSLIASAIVLQAAQDYRIYSKILSRDPTNLDALRILSDVERFFRSQWFYELTGADGTVMLARLEREGMKGRNKMRARRCGGVPGNVW
jgi:hypothetical protein